MDRNPGNLPKKASGKYCNARTPVGGGKYCGKLAGAGTDHLGYGRCNLHGGDGSGRPLMTGFYSTKIKKTLNEQMIAIAEDPQFSTMLEEFASLKLVVGNILEGLPEDLGEQMFKTDALLCSKCGGGFTADSGTQRRVKMLIDVIEKLSKIHKRIIETSIVMNKVITMDQLQYLYKKIASIILEATEDKEVAEKIFEQLQETPLFFREGK